MHILFITEFFPDLDNPIITGGVESRIYYTAKYLAQSHQITVIARRKHQESKLQTSKNLTVYRLGSPTTTSAASISSLFSRILFIMLAFFKGLSIKADLVEGSNVVVYLPAFLIGSIKRIPKIAWYPDVLIGQWRRQFGFILGTIGELSERIFTKLNWDHMITISVIARDRLIKAHVSPSRITVIPCGVDFKKIVHLPDNKKFDQLLVISRLVPYKRISWAIELLYFLTNRTITSVTNAKNHPESILTTGTTTRKIKNPFHLSSTTQNWIAMNRKYLKNLKLVIIGSGPEKTKLKAKIKKLKLKNRIIFKHDVDTKQLHYEILKSKLLIHPSLIEGFGIVLVEASAAGTPYIAADIPTSIALTKSLRSGEVFDHNNFDQLVEKTVTLLTDHKKYQWYQDHGKANAREYDWQKLADHTAKLYEKLI